MKEGKNLVIVESPAKAGTIQKFLGEGFTVKSSFGHIRDLSDNELSIDIQGGFAPEYGTIYTRNQINEALQSETPRDIVPEVDTNGHGTFLASIAAGREEPANDFIGAAPRCELVIVKLKEAKESLREFYYMKGDELVKSDLKRSVGSMASSQSKEELEHNVRSHLKSLQLCPSKISSFFNAPCTSYAA